MAICSTVHQNSQLPCNVKPHKEPSAFAGTLQMLCGMRTACHGWRNIWWAELRRTERQLPNGRRVFCRLSLGRQLADCWPSIGRLLADSWPFVGSLLASYRPRLKERPKRHAKLHFFVFDQLFFSSILELFSPNCNLVTGSLRDWLASLNM